VSDDARVAPPARPESGETAAGLAEPPVVLYDGWCNLCDSSVAFILRRDRHGVFRFAALQSATARKLLGACAPDKRLDETLVLVHRARCETRSDAILTILGLLPAPWPVFRGLCIVPRRLRDWTYDFVARRRTRWFGRTTVCMTSLAAYADRFFD